MPETAQLRSMFSVLASTSPTAPTDDSNFAAGGAKGGGSAWRTGFMAITAPTAKTNAMAAIKGTVFFMILASCRRGKTLRLAPPMTRLQKLPQDRSSELRSFGFPLRTQSGHRPYGRFGRRNRKCGHHG